MYIFAFVNKNVWKLVYIFLLIYLVQETSQDVQVTDPAHTT